MASTLFEIPKTPALPHVGYYDINKNSQNKNSATLHTTNISNSCTNNWDSQTCIGGQTCGSDYIYNITLSGSLMNVDGSGNLSSIVSGSSKDQITNQIQYLSCQLANARSRQYNSNKFDITASNVSVVEIFKQYSNLKPWLIAIFFITI